MLRGETVYIVSKARSSPSTACRVARYTNLLEERLHTMNDIGHKAYAVASGAISILSVAG